MATKTAWLVGHGCAPIYTREYGTDDPCDDWPVSLWGGKAWVTYDWEEVWEPGTGRLFGWSPITKEFR